MPAPRVAVVGSGPAGLAAGYYLALSGVQVTIFERRAVPGGMPAIAPRFRLPEAVVQADVERITALGVELKLSHPLTQPPEALLEQGYAAVYLGPGFQQDARLEIEGIDGRGVLTALGLLEDVARGETPDLGKKVLVIGGGNTAMDAARTARRLTGQPATVVYRRSQAEMPAEPQELQDLLDEGNLLLELAAPRRVLLEGGRVVGLECVRNVEAGEDWEEYQQEAATTRDRAIAILEHALEAALHHARFLAEREAANQAQLAREREHREQQIRQEAAAAARADPGVQEQGALVHRLAVEGHLHIGRIVIEGDRLHDRRQVHQKALDAAASVSYTNLTLPTNYCG